MESQSPDSDASVDESLFALLLDLGIPEAAARRDEDEAQGSDVNLLPSRHHKMVFVVNMELSMGTGKVGHAAIGLFQLVHEKPSQRGMINQWDEHGAKKVVLQGVNTDQLLELHALALSLELPTYLVQDAGRTQVPAGSQTVLAIIGEEELVNQVTGQLKLLN
ncbi:putative peptidyl-tRNA hydrolase 2 [Ophiophagus hannah]|uniref:peptidyl-tRNA hydrolase n=1 Tax=Ophiophagus hannah TaxID=8665 RepID=V8NJH7_OPHHA|nr:putative peptidyl-tRNA hydrolase 2 [Ophiophagus hannah]